MLQTDSLDAPNCGDDRESDSMQQQLFEMIKDRSKRIDELLKFQKEIKVIQCDEICMLINVVGARFIKTRVGIYKKGFYGAYATKEKSYSCTHYEIVNINLSFCIIRIESTPFMSLYP